MPAIDPATLDRWRTLSIVDRDGGTVGSISEFYLDRETRYPTWALVNVGLFGARQMFVPLLGATEINDGLQVPYEKSHIKDAPRIDLHGELTPDEEATLFAHYGIEYQPAPEEAGVADAAGVGAAEAPGAAGVGAAGAAGAGAAGPTGAAEDAAAEARGAESGDDEPGATAAEAESAEATADEPEAGEDTGPAAEPGSHEHASAAAEPDPATPDEWAAAGRQPADDGNPGRAPATDELAWPASPPPPGPITEPPAEPPEVPSTDRDR